MNQNYYYQNKNEQNDINNQNSIYSINKENYIDNILKINKGKKATIYITIPESKEYQDKTLEGIIESSGKDHIIISKPTTGEWLLIPIIYLNFISFSEPINHTQLQY